ncbi:Dbl homology domain-containing protein [Fennellomyces sp. T-0311]|nr:Dbl homology domain-containing protein [Fennellomyces sp. T-0311]
MQGCNLDDDFSANEISNAPPLGNNAYPREPTVSTASGNEGNGPSQGFGLLRRLSRFGSAPTTKTPRRATSLLVSTHPSKATKQPDKATLSRSMSLSEYYRRRFSSLIVTNNEFGNSMTRARSVLFRNKQERAVAIYKRSVAQLDSPASSPVLLPVADTKTSSKNEAMRAFILNELYATETSYYRLLDLIYTKYMQPMDAAMQNKDPLLVKKSGDIPILFGHLPQLLKVSQTLIQMLDQQLHVAHAFMGLQDELAVFLRYAVHYKRYFKTIRRACQTNSLLLSIERECLAQRESNRMGMSDYLIAPIQRVPRYCLLIQDLIKHTPTTDPAYFELRTVFKMMTTLASVMNIDDV